MISVTMLGSMVINTPGQRLRLDLGPSGRLLAGYLLQFPSRVHRRDYLADMFWPQRPVENARAALNTALWRFRKLLAVEPESRGAANLSSTPMEVVLERAPWLHVDTHTFDTGLRSALQTARLGGSAASAQLEEALDAYSGCFLDGEEADWVIAERERLHSLYVRGLCELVRIHAAADELESAIAAVRKALAVDRFRETLIRWLALLLFLNGQRAQAITEMNRWQTALRAEIGIEPLPQTTALRASLTSGSICADADQLRTAYFHNTPSGL